MERVIYLILIVFFSYGLAVGIDCFVKVMNSKKSRYFNISTKVFVIFRFTALRKNLVSRASLVFQIWIWISVIAFVVIMHFIPIDLLALISRVLSWTYAIVTTVLFMIGGSLRPKDIDRMSKF